MVPYEGEATAGEFVVQAVELASGALGRPLDPVQDPVDGAGAIEVFQMIRLMGKGPPRARVRIEQGQDALQTVEHGNSLYAAGLRRIYQAGIPTPPNANVMDARASM